MENTSSKKKIINLDPNLKISWDKVCLDIKEKLGKDIYESWIKKLNLIEELEHYIVLSAPTRFIRDWVVSRYLDQIIEIVKLQRKNISRVDFIVETNEILKNSDNNLKKVNKVNGNSSSNISYIENSSLAYTRIDPNKKFENFVLGSSNSLAFEACKKFVNKFHTTIHFFYMEV